MKNIAFIFLIIGNLLIAKDPIVLIHGFLGWGRDEMAGKYLYWGGNYDIEQDLKNAGYEVYTVSVGPISSNWDRAVECYYQIKGGQTDYGIMHSKKHGLIQTPANKTYDALIPDWSQIKPIHIIAHSQGGQTARMLEHLLNTVFENETSSLLSQPKQGWIKSITTISTPHNGTTFASYILDYFPIIQNIVPFLSIINQESINSFYNFDLEQWSFNKKNKNFFASIDMLENHPFQNSENLASFDLSIDGAKKMNSYVSNNPNTYYYSIVSNTTKRIEGKLKTLQNTNFKLVPTSLLIANNNLVLKYIDENNLFAWKYNDGIVNSISMFQPLTLSPLNQNLINNYYAKLQNSTAMINVLTNNYQLLSPGKWHPVAIINLDHHAIVGHHVNQTNYNMLIAFYLQHLSEINQLN